MFLATTSVQTLGFLFQGNIVGFFFSKMSQALTNYRQGHTGTTPAITWVLMILGNAGRIFNLIFGGLGKELTLLVGKIMAILPAIIVLSQIWYQRKITAYVLSVEKMEKVLIKVSPENDKTIDKDQLKEFIDNFNNVKMGFEIDSSICDNFKKIDGDILKNDLIDNLNDRLIKENDLCSTDVSHFRSNPIKNK